MENKFYIKKLDSYEKASEISKIRMGTEPSYDLDLLPSVQMQKEMRKFLKYRGQQLGAEKFYTERRFYHHLCKMLQTRRDRPESFLDWDKEKWKQQMKIWLLQQGLPLTEISKSHCGNETVSQAKTLHYIDRLIDYFLDLRDADVDEMTKDVWQLEKLDIQVKQDLTRTARIINFKEISQQDLREEVKKAIYFQLKTESIGTVKKEMTAIRRFSRYLKENNKEVDSCSKLDRKIMEEYLIYMKTEDTGTKRYRAELTRLRALLNMVADVYQYPQVKDLILNRDIPPDIRGEIKIYSDQELKRFNAFLTKVDVQTARLMLIHQMLGTRMSDTLTLRTDCLIEKDGETIIQIHQMKTHFYEKPISQELAALIKEAIRYREKEHGKGKYIFTSLSDPSKPMKYATVQQKITDKIYQENLRDDKGEYFGFGSHMYRHIYGMKLAEMHVDDWTIARLLGHRAKALLEEAGKADGFELTASYHNIDEDTKKVLELWKSELSKLNVTLNIEANSWEVVYNKAKSANPEERDDLFICKTFADTNTAYGPYSTCVESGAGWNFSGIKNAEYDEKIEAAYQAGAFDQRQFIDGFHEVGAKIAEDCFQMNLYDFSQITAVSKDFHGFTLNPAYQSAVLFYNCYKGNE